MPRVFVYEYLTAHGIGRDPGSPDHGMYREGRAMRDAVLADFKAVPGVEVEMLEGVTAETDLSAFRRTAERCDHVLLIAPEFDFLLETRATWVRAHQLLGPAADAIAKCRDKPHLAGVWAAAGIPTPPGERACDGGLGRFPCVIKPVDGAGSVATYYCGDEAEYTRLVELAYRESPGDPWVQQYVRGRAASIAFLIGPNQTIPLLPTFQRLSADGRFHYLGGELPVPPELAGRLAYLGLRAVSCVDGLAGYVGVDMVLGDAADGSEDYAIEINPRLTTSYVGLRSLCESNLAEAMIRVCEGRPVEPLRWKPGRVRFHPDGAVEYDPTPGAVYQ